MATVDHFYQPAVKTYESINNQPALNIIEPPGTINEPFKHQLATTIVGD